MCEKDKFSLKSMSLKEKVELLNGSGLWKIPTIESLGNPEFVMTDGTYGVRYNTGQVEGGKDWCLEGFLEVVNQKADESYGYSESATCFPNGSSLGCSWDKELVFKMGEALAKECQYFGVNLLLGPAINIRRTPLAGRGYEYYSEDPVVSGDLAAALINGLQTNHVGACLKHFACNNSEFKRTEMDSIVDTRALREIYLHGFERAVEQSSPWALMSSYNKLNGTYTSQNSWLLDSVLREEWGYEGVVVSDWYGIKDRGSALLAGNDLAMPESEYNKKNLTLAIKDGRVTNSDLDKSCARILDMVAKAHPVKHAKDDQTIFVENHKLAQKIASESIVLLKNTHHVLPLTHDKFKNIAVIGQAAQEPVFQGSGCATTAPFFVDCPLDEIINIAGNEFDISYQRGTGSAEELQNAIELSKKSDVAILFTNTLVGFDGENGDRENLNLIEEHEQLIKAISAVQPNIVVVLSNSDSVVMPWERNVCAIVETFFSGQGMGRAVADILFGHVNPSGKLTVTVPNSVEETPAYLTYPGENNQHQYSEGLFVGYRYYDKRNLNPLFPFGFGLSYTEFQYDNLSLSSDTMKEGDTLSLRFDITNTGDRYGKEIPQIYISAPAGNYAREKYALKAFDKIGLEARETKTITITLPWREFCYFNPKKNAWKAESGSHVISVGKSSRDLVLTATVQLKAEKLYPELHQGSTLVDLIENPQALERALDLLSNKSSLSCNDIKRKLFKIAPDLFFGIDVVFSDMLDVNINDEEISWILGHK
ncbi:beta-glucosidase [Aliivibrio fischeri]|uniref:beta-glucosidase n=1 Tax=Aliivibrio fischeri TaxID=668 RepID=UPI00084CB1B3|nr:glycoside hydrolase family 3 C-terminal domain-containing protein [Aliivibrio fischeri]OED53753.1 glycosyl hydrolase [Aliivibrio fischeri]